MTDSSCQPAEKVCLNCGAACPGAYCPDCGQRDVPLRQSLGHFLKDTTKEFLGVDGRLWRTLGILFVHPGRLTLEYLAGRRARYLGPHRIYLSASVLFFFVLTILDPIGRVERAVVGGDPDSTATVAARLDVIAHLLERSDRNVVALAAKLDSTQAFLSSRLDSTSGGDQKWIRVTRESALAGQKGTLERARRERVLTRQRLDWQRAMLDTLDRARVIRPKDYDDAAALIFQDTSSVVSVGGFGIEADGTSAPDLQSARTGSEKREALGALARGAVSHLPLVMFLLLPVFALFMKLLYVRSNWFYTEHLIFALHVHAFAFVVTGLVAVLAGYFNGSGWAAALSLVLLIWLPVYFVVAQKRVYDRPWLRTIVKAGLLAIFYPTVLLGGIALSFLLAAELG